MMPTPKRLTGQSPAHARSRSQEKEIAKATGGRQTPGSGNKAVKGDVKVPGFLRIEAKTTVHNSFTVTSEHVSKIKAAARGTTEIPMMAIELGDGTKFVLLPEDALETVLDAVRR